MTYKFGKNKSRVISLILSVSLLFNLLGVLAPTIADAASGVPTILSYQGRLTNSSGDLVGGSGTAYNFKFSIWDNPTVDLGNRL